MIQIYDSSNTNFEKNGDMVLQPSSMTLHCVLNGEWTAELVHPVDEDGRWKHIVENSVVKCPSFLQSDQLYRIKAVSRNDSEVTADLEPILLDAVGDCWISDIRPTGKTGQQALNDMLSPNSKYSGSSDILTVTTAYWQNMNAIEALNGDIDQSFINRWGGEIVYNNFELIVNQRAGADHGVSVRYGKNLPVDGMEYTVDMSEVVTRIYPQAYNGREMSNHGHVDSEHINDYPTVFSKSMKFDDVRLAEDVSDTEGTDGMIICNTQSELNDALRQKCEEQFEQGIDVPRVTIKVDMVLLQNTENYADVSELEYVSLGDDVQCVNAQMGVNTKSRVVELEYDACNKSVTNVTIGDVEPSYFSDVTSSVKDSADRIGAVTTLSGDLIAERVQGTLNAIKTQLKLQSTVAEKVDGVAFLIEDLDPNSDMYGAMEAGSQGLRIANERTADGKAWNWRTAITADGMVADLIETGTLRAIDIEGVNITGSNITGSTITGTTINGSYINGARITFGNEGTNQIVARTATFADGYTGVLFSGTGDFTVQAGSVGITSKGLSSTHNQLQLVGYNGNDQITNSLRFFDASFFLAHYDTSGNVMSIIQYTETIGLYLANGIPGDSRSFISMQNNVFAMQFNERYTLQTADKLYMQVINGLLKISNNQYFGTPVIHAKTDAGDHAVAFSWDGSRLELWVDTTFIGYVNTSK